VSKHELAAEELRSKLDAVQDTNKILQSACDKSLAEQEERHQSALNGLRSKVLNLEHELLKMMKTGSRNGAQNQRDSDTVPFTFNMPKDFHQELFGPLDDASATDNAQTGLASSNIAPSESVVPDLSYDDATETESTISATSDDGFYVMEPNKVQTTSSAASESSINTSSSFSTSIAKTAQSSTFDNTGPLAVAPSQLNRLIRAAFLLNAKDGQDLLDDIDREDVIRAFMPFEMFLKEYYKFVPGGKRRGKGPRQDIIWRQLREIMYEPSQAAGLQGRPPLWEGCGPQGIGKERK
jgi:hypothetical protein